MNFKRTNRHLPGSGFRRLLSNVSREQIVRVFGEWDEQGSQWPKYGEDLLVKSELGHSLTIYSSFGQYRIGAHESIPVGIIDELHRVLENA